MKFLSNILEMTKETVLVCQETFDKLACMVLEMIVYYIKLCYYTFTF